jgi:predicted AAA+ superfamily ATPase
MVTSSRYLPRIVDGELDELAVALPAIAIEGPKGVGKTATASRRARTVHALDDPAQRNIAVADPARLLDHPPPVLVDEWQRLPEIWDLVRRRVDGGASPGQFLLAGSALPAGPPTHSGAARIVTLRMRPMSLAERSGNSPTVSLRELLAGRRSELSGRTTWRLEDYVDEILRSGFPGLRELTGRPLRVQLDGYLRRIVDRDFPDELDREVRNPDGLRRWMTAYAAASSTAASFEKIRDAATAGQGEKPAKTTIGPYRTALERLWILDPVPAWAPTRSHIRRLAMPPKHQLADPALAARLLGVDAGALLKGDPAGSSTPRDGTLLGALFESLVTLSVRVYAQAAEVGQVGHLRTRAGEHEVDLVLDRGDGRVLAIEVKLKRTVEDEDARHLNWLAERIGDDLLDAAIVTTGPEAYRRPDGIAIIPAALLGP